MGGAGESSEELPESVGQQIGRVEVEIERVQERISGVEESIRGVEEEIRNCIDIDERKLLRAEKAELRAEKAVLLTKEAELRTKEAELRTKEADLRALLSQGRGLGTEHEWLVQKVLELDLPSGASVYPSSSNRNRMWTPVEVEHWDVKEKIEILLTEADSRNRVYELNVNNDTSHKVETGGTFFVGAILYKLRTFMKKKGPQFNFGLKPEARLAPKRVDESAPASEVVNAFTKGYSIADYLATLQTKKGFVVEVKNGGLGPRQGDSWDLHKFWAECKQGEGDWCESVGITVSHKERVMRCINQLYEYIILAEVGYGVLTDSRYWYLFKRDNAGPLKISTGFKASDDPPRVLAALSYLVITVSTDNCEYSNPTENGQFPGGSDAALSKSSDGSSDDEFKDPDYRGPRSISSGSEVRRSGRPSADGSQRALQDISAEDLNLKWSGIISCEGASGFVVIGHLHGQPVAVKFADIGTERAEALLQEVVAYMKMEKLWGRVVPKLVGYGTTNSGQVVFVATELIEGVELGQVAVTREVETAALEALDAVHACGLLHGDISHSNIMVVLGRQPSVRIVDFGLSCVNSNKKFQRAERICLERLLVHMVK